MVKDNENYDDIQDEYYDKKLKKSWNNFRFNFKFFVIILFLSFLYYLFFNN